jgi:hypothetical protein
MIWDAIVDHLHFRYFSEQLPLFCVKQSRSGIEDFPRLISAYPVNR